MGRQAASSPPHRVRLQGFSPMAKFIPSPFLVRGGPARLRRQQAAPSNGE